MQRCNQVKDKKAAEVTVRHQSKGLPKAFESVWVGAG